MAAIDFIRGADVSTLPMLEAAGAVYFDKGRQRELFRLLRDNGVNALRARLWVDPRSPGGAPYGGGTNDLGCLSRLFRRGKARGMRTLLSFHYSDFWSDPGKQHPPKAWRGLSLDQTKEAVAAHTAAALDALAAQGLPPDDIQIGNEITGGLLWPLGRAEDMPACAGLLNAGIRAARRCAPGARVLLHLDCGGDNARCTRWLDRYFACGGEAIDGIGLSYYAAFHGTMQELSDNIAALRARYGVPVSVVETASAHMLANAWALDGLPLGDAHTRVVEFPLTPEGQERFLQALIRALYRVGAEGVYYWEPAWLPIAGCGWANEAALDYLQLPPGAKTDNEWAHMALFDAAGEALPGLRALGGYRP